MDFTTAIEELRKDAKARETAALMLENLQNGGRAEKQAIAIATIKHRTKRTLTPQARARIRRAQRARWAAWRKRQGKVA